MKFFLIIFVLAVLAGCKTNYVYMNVQEPAPVTIPAAIKSVGIINRSIASSSSKIVNGVDQVLSLESKNLDKDGSVESVSSLKNELSKNTRFTSVKILNLDMRTYGAGVFPAQISWDTITRICNEQKVDALFVLEMFDTDSKISYATHNTTIKTPLGDVPAIEHEASMTTIVKVGWRIYDGNGKALLDEFPTSKSATFSGRGINPVVAAGALLGRKDAVNQIGVQLGEEYAQSILPFWIKVTREYYVKGTNNFKTAKRRAQTGNWDGAAELWLKETDNPKGKVAGRACYNMAIINEINGNLDDAIVWAQKSYEDYGNKLALGYVNILKNRKARVNKLNRQQAQ